MSLPSGYKRLEYIQSSGTQYINTGFIPKSTSKVFADFQVTEKQSTNNDIFGVVGQFSFRQYANSDFFRTVCGSAADFETGVSILSRHVVEKTMTETKIDGLYSVSTDASTVSNAIFLFAYNAGSYVSNYGYLKLYSCKIYDNDVLTRDFIPCETDIGAVGLWDDVNSVFYVNAGTGTFTAGPVMAIAAAASEVTELEYIQSSGTQYIDTNVSAPEGFRITCDVEFTSLPNTLNMLFGSHDTASPYYRNFLAATSGGKWEIGAYNPYDFGTAAINTRYAIDVCTISGAIGCSINGIDQIVDSSIAASTVRSSRTIYVFGLNYPDGLLPSNMKLYGLKMYLDADGSNLVRDFIAAKLSDGTLGLYDKLHGLLYINVGSGVFTAGPEVPKAPSAPPGFTAVRLTDTAVQLNWTASDGATGYKLYKNGDLLATLTETSYVDTVQAFSGTVYSIIAYNDDGESEAAALTYYSTPENPILYLVTDRTAADVTARNEKGTYRSADLNRVGFTVQYLVDYLSRNGITVDVYPKRDWTDMGHPTPSDMRIYLNDISTLRAALKLPKDTATVPEDMVNLTYQEANDIESILVVLYEMIGKMISVVDAGWTSGMAYTGFYFKEATV